MTSNGTDEIDYEIKYTLDRIDGIETRNAVIEASLNSEYAEFKEINGNNIESTVSNEGKKIEVRINNEEAINLYNKMGFETVRIRKHYYEDGSDAYDMIKAIGGLSEKDFSD